MATNNIMNNKPKVTIVILNFNRPNDTIECIESIEKNNYSNYNIMLVDNASTDNSVTEFTDKIPHIKTCQTGENLGYTGGVNYGIKKALEEKPDYILLLNNDTIVDPDFLSELTAEMERNKQAAAACGLIIAEHDRQTVWYGGGKIIYWRGLAVHSHKGEKYERIKNLDEPSFVNFVTGCMILIRASLIEELGLEDERFYMYLDDIELSARIVRKGFNLLYVPKSIIYHKVLNEELSPLKRYYSVRNRMLLISEINSGSSKFLSSLLFLIIISCKLIYWRIFKREFYLPAKAGLIDFFIKRFNKGRGHQFLINY